MDILIVTDHNRSGIRQNPYAGWSFLLIDWVRENLTAGAPQNHTFFTLCSHFCAKSDLFAHTGPLYCIQANEKTSVS
jgi:hypothetical protein